MRHRTLILEVTTSLGDRLHGRQGEAGASLMHDAEPDALPEIDATGLYMYVGHDRLAARLIDILGVR